MPLYLKPLLAVVAVLIAGAFVVKFTPRVSVPLAFEVSSFEGDAQIYDPKSHDWRPPKQGEEFRTSQKVKTGPDGQISLQVEDEIRLRIKGSSELENIQSAVVGKREVYKLHFGQGVLFGVTSKAFDRKRATKEADFQITTPKYDVDVMGSVFRIETSRVKGGRNWVGVLRGSVEVSPPSLFFRKGGTLIRGLEQVSVAEGVIQPITRVTRGEWGFIKEAYQLLEKTAVKEAEQIDLSKHAGSFFEHVFDHGTFFTPNVGYCGREFFRDSDTGGVYLDVEYDVFPAGSFDGVYIKTRNFDISQYSGFSMEVQRSADEGVPESFFIELKSKGNTVRRFSPRGFERTWKKMEFDFNASRPTPVNEVVFVFTNARVGEAKKGVLEFRNINLLPRLELTAAPAAGATKASAPVPAGSAASQPQPVVAAPALPVVIPVVNFTDAPEAAPFESASPQQSASASPATPATTGSSSSTAQLPEVPLQ